MFKVEYYGFEAQKRARTSFKSFNKFYDPSAKEKLQVVNIIRKAAMIQNINKFENVPLGIVTIFIKKYRKNISIKNRCKINFWDTKPDSDNLEKFVFDSLEQSNIIDNDSRIVAKLCLKLWGEYDYTIFFLDEFRVDSKFFYSDNSVGFNGVFFNYNSLEFYQQ